MPLHTLISGCLLGFAAASCLLCSLGLIAVHDAYQRLHFSSPIASIAIALIAIAVWIEDPQWQAKLKAVFIALLLFLMNAVLTHATARAIRLRKLGKWEVLPEEHALPEDPRLPRQNINSELDKQ